MAMTPVGSDLRQKSVNSYTFVYGAIILALLSHLSSPKIFHYFPETSKREFPYVPVRNIYHNYGWISGWEDGWTVSCG